MIRCSAAAGIFDGSGDLGCVARIYRVSFSGKLTYEIDFPANAALRIWKTLLADDRSDDLESLGAELLVHLRLAE